MSSFCPYVLSGAFDRNGISDPSTGITETKITSYSSARSMMVNYGVKNVLYINNYPMTRTEREQYVPTSLVPNIANTLVDDSSNETGTAGNVLWPYKPILLLANKQVTT